MAQVRRTLPAYQVNILVACIIKEQRTLAAYNRERALDIHAAGMGIFKLPCVLSGYVGHAENTVPSPASAALIGEGQRESASTIPPTPTSSASFAANPSFFLPPPARSFYRQIPLL